MRIISSVLLAAVAASSIAAVPAEARKRDRYYYGNQSYSSYAQCKRARDRAAKRGTVIGAVGAGAGAAILGGNVGESLLGAGVGAVAGNAIGRGSEKRCDRGR
jgi:outer membrane lipoprotein SlyB